MDALEAIKKRRSVRSFTGDPVPREHLEIIVDAARLAPSGNNQQPWEFIIITSQQTIQNLKVAAPWIDKAGAVIAVLLNPASRWWLEDGAAAVENMLIAATSLGYGSCWLEGYTLQHEYEFKALLNIPENLRLLTLVPIGIPVKWPEKEKRSLDEVIHWEKF